MAAERYRDDDAMRSPGAHREGEMGAGVPEQGALSQADIRRWQGRWVFDEHGESIGRVADVLIDDRSSPEWIIVSTGPFLHIDKLVPLFDMEVRGDALVLPYSREMVKKGPTVDVDDMSDDEEQELYSYWCVDKTAALPRTCSRLSRGAA